MTLKPALTIPALGTKRFVIGVVAGVAFAASFYFASVAVTRSGMSALLGNPEARIEDIQSHNEHWHGSEGFFPRPVAEPTAETPVWAEPFWAVLSAVLGHAMTVSVWFLRPRRRRASLRLRGGVATGLMWVALVPLVLAPFWESYLTLVTRGNYWAMAFGEPQVPDPLVPFIPFGAAASALVLVVGLEPWRGVQLTYRCGWWPPLSIAAALALGATLYGVSLLLHVPTSAF